MWKRRMGELGGRDSEWEGEGEREIERAREGVREK